VQIGVEFQTIILSLQMQRCWALYPKSDWQVARFGGGD